MLSFHSLNAESNRAEIQTLAEMHHIPNKNFTPQLKARKELLYIYKKGAIFNSLYKSQLSIGNLNDYLLNAIATTANLHCP
jgi:hypothetical protein